MSASRERPEGRGPRVVLRHPVYIGHVGGTAPPERCLAQDISFGGMFVWSGRRFPSGTLLSIDLEAHGHPTPFAEGEVLWCRDDLSLDQQAAWRMPGFAVRFFPLSSRAQALLELLVLGPPGAAANPSATETATITGL